MGPGHIHAGWEERLSLRQGRGQGLATLHPLGATEGRDGDGTATSTTGDLTWGGVSQQPHTCSKELLTCSQQGLVRGEKFLQPSKFLGEIKPLRAAHKFRNSHGSASAVGKCHVTRDSVIFGELFLLPYGRGLA